ncbi:hypothetical protein [Psychroserpens sp. S379A]|uniref:hypothetical protein n=1 Tax=Psychroserpens sp. S379A TaxID=3415137 RepID=UPI003C7DF646
MKKLFLVALAFFGVVTLSNAQEIADNAIGLRLGDSDGIGPGINYQRALGESNRLEVDLGWRDGSKYNIFKLAGLYQWVWNLDGNFNWYAGAGAGIGSVKIDNAPSGVDNSETFAFAAGDIGIEYSFDIPLLLSLDFRPEIGFGNDDFDTNDLDFDIALSVRYQF